MLHCTSCKSTQLEEAGLQWFPLSVFNAHTVQPLVTDPVNHPNEGALHLYTCSKCHTTFLEPFEALTEK